MAEGEAGWQITSVTHGAQDLGEVKEAVMIEEVNTGEIRGLDSRGPAALPLGEERVLAEVSTLNRNDYVAKGTKATLTINLKDADDGVGSIAATDMRRLTQRWGQRILEEHQHGINFAHEGSLASTPITVTV